MTGGAKPAFQWIRRAMLFLIVGYMLAVAARVYVRKFYIWLPDYISWSAHARSRPSGPVHIFFLYTDHFEPGANAGMVRRWSQEYPKLAQRHHDSRGRPPQHTWFYPGEQPIDATMAALQRLTAAGYGEVELHLHHDGDDETSARERYGRAIAYFQKFGFLETVDGRTCFAFIHGNYGLDNSMGPKFCGVNRELALLRALGCFADFTFPSLWQAAQPSLVNTIFEATDDDRPKSYDRGVPLRVGGQRVGDLLIFPGPLIVAGTLDPRRLFFRVEDSDVHPTVPLTSRRVDLWVQTAIHVDGRPEWVFIKAHSHAASSDADAGETLGPNFDRALTYLESQYNDGTAYVLHYVTARQAYNLARAAQDGQQGDPELYLDWEIKPYVANQRRP